MMTFEEFQNRACLYVLGALDAVEMRQVEQARKEFGQKAEDFIQECYASHEAFALTLRPAASWATLRDRLLSMVHGRQQRG